MSNSTWRRIQAAGDPLLRYLLFSKETPLTDEIHGSSHSLDHFAWNHPVGQIPFLIDFHRS